MNGFQALRRLRSFQKGKPLPRGSTLHFPMADPKDSLVVAFLRMGGESAPWGIAWGRPGSRPQFATAPEPRNRDMVADAVAAFAPALLEHLYHPKYSARQVTSPDDSRPLRQIWLPNVTHLDMLHMLSYAYTRTKWGTAERRELLRALGRAAGWVFREAQRPGQCLAMVATESLRQCFTFPADDTRQGHLGFLMAWLETRAGRDARIAAATEAERQSIATSLDPPYEREVLQPLVEQFNTLRAEKDDAGAARVAREVDKALTAELRRRFDLTVRALDLMRADRRRPNAALERLTEATQAEHWYQYLRLEYQLDDNEDGPYFAPSPETDRHPAAASSRYYVYEASAELVEAALLHDDDELQREAIAAGDAIRGTIVDVSDEGEGRASVPIWLVETAGDLPLRLREGTELSLVGLARRKGRIRYFEPTRDGNTRFEIEITALTGLRGRDLPKGTRAANDPELKGTTLTLVKAADGGISRAKSGRVWKSDSPGAWLTHARPGGVRATLPSEVEDDLDSLQARLRPGGRP